MIRVIPQPLLEAFERDVYERHMAFCYNDFGNGRVCMTVTSRIGQSANTPVGQSNPRRALNLRKKQFYPVGYIQNFQMFAV